MKYRGMVAEQAWQFTRLGRKATRKPSAGQKSKSSPATADQREMKINSTIIAGLVCIRAAMNGAFAAETNVNDRLKALEDAVQTLQQENKDLKSQLGWDGKSPLVVAKAAGKETRLVLGGLVQGQAEFGGVPDSRFIGIEDRALLRRARVSVCGGFLEYFDFKLEADFGANSLSEKSSYSGQITDAFLNWNRYDAANVKCGQFKTPFGYDQLVSDSKGLTIERSLVNDRLTDGRQIGLGVTGDFLKKRLGYSIGTFMGTGVNNSFNDNDRFLFAGRLYGVPVRTELGKYEFKWTLAINGLSTRDNGLSRNGFGFDSTPATAALDNLFSGNRESFGVDTQFRWGPWGLDAEYLQTHVSQIPPGVPTTLNASGWYMTGTYLFLPKWQAVVRYERFDPMFALANNTTEEWTFGLTYYLKGDDLKFMVNYLVGHTGSNDDEGRLLTRVQYMF